MEITLLLLHILLRRPDAAEAEKLQALCSPTISKTFSKQTIGLPRNTNIDYPDLKVHNSSIRRRTATKAAEFALLGASYYDFVITDVRMPDINKQQMYNSLKAINRM